MLVINQSCHGKNTHRFIIGLALHFYSFFFYHPPSSSLNLSAPTVQKTHRRDTHMLYCTHRQTLCCKCAFTMTAMKSLEVTQSLLVSSRGCKWIEATETSLSCSKCWNHSTPKPLLHFLFYIYYMARHKIMFVSFPNEKQHVFCPFSMTIDFFSAALFAFCFPVCISTA